MEELKFNTAESYAAWVKSEVQKVYDDCDMVRSVYTTFDEYYRSVAAYMTADNLLQQTDAGDIASMIMDDTFPTIIDVRGADLYFENEFGELIFTDTIDPSNPEDMDNYRQLFQVVLDYLEDNDD